MAPSERGLPAGPRLHLAGSLVQAGLLIFLVAISVLKPWKKR